MNQEETTQTDIGLHGIYDKLEVIKKMRDRVVEGLIVKVNRGTLGQFIGRDNLRRESDAEKEAIQIYVKGPEGEVTKTMKLSVHKKSTLQLYRQHYGKYPEVGDKVSLKFDLDDGFWRVDLG